MTETLVRDEFADSLLSDFLDESSQLLERLNENLLQLDSWVRSLADGQRARCDESLMNDMFRSAHSIKGLSAMLGLHEINNLTHKVENVFDAARRDELSFTPDIVELMFQAADRLSAQVEGLRSPDSEAVDCSTVLSAIQTLLKFNGSERKQTTQADAEKALSEELAVVAQAAAALPNQEDEPVTPNVQPTNTACASPRAIGTAAASQDHFASVVDDTQIPAKYLSIFIDETELALDDLTETLLAVECDHGRDPTEKLLITSHRIKGSAACVGFHRAAKLAHFMEDLLQRLHHEGGVLTSEMTDALLKCTDGLRKYVDGLKTGAAESDSFNLLAQELLLAQSGNTSTKKCEPAAVAPAAETAIPTIATGDAGMQLLRQVAQQAPNERPGFAGRITFVSGLPLAGLKARLAYDKLSQVGDVYFCEPSAALLDEMDEIKSLVFGLCSNESRENLLAGLRITGIQQVDVYSLKALLPAVELPTEKAAVVEMPEPVVSENVAAATTLPVSTAGTASVETVLAEIVPRDAKATADNGANSKTNDAKPTETLRVDIERLDQLMNLAGQLVINKARFAQIGERLKQVSLGKQAHQAFSNISGVLARLADPGPATDTRRNPQSELDNLRNQARRVQSDLEDVRRTLEQFTTVRSSVNDLSEAVHQLDLVSDGIQKSVMDTRMVPIGPLFGRFRRVIRDMTRTNGKDIQLVIRGEKTELDKRMIDELGDPLIHMVRNSADHGIESPDVREQAGKSRQGTITLDAFHRGNSIVIVVSDDGKGLDQDRIRDKAIEKGLISAADAEKLTPHQIYQLIWEPGFSTAEKVTEISGRGMGMDIVKSKIEEINGVVDLDSTPGQGTTLTIKLPLTLAILPSLMAEIDGDVVALPIESVVEIVNIRRAELRAIHGMPTALVRGRVISVVHLSEVLSWHGTSINNNAKQTDDITLVILGTEGREIGLEVHRLLGEEDIVIKSMAENFRNVFGIAGASILGDGRVSLILDIAALIEKASRLTPALAAT